MVNEPVLCVVGRVCLPVSPSQGLCRSILRLCQLSLDESEQTYVASNISHPLLSMRDETI